MHHFWWVIQESAELIVGYNVYFDIKKLKNWGINFDEKKTYDVMTNYVVLNGEWDEYRCDCKWKKLYECAVCFGYEFDAHDSLEDAKATLHCYRKIQEIPITENCPYV